MDGHVDFAVDVLAGGALGSVLGAKEGIALRLCAPLEWIAVAFAACALLTPFVRASLEITTMIEAVKRSTC